MPNQINWEYSTSKVTTHFTVNDLIYLSQWGRLANEVDGLTEEIKDNLCNLAAKMEVVRHFLGDKIIHVHCCFRSPLYNKLVNGALKSSHLIGCAMDFHYDNNDTADECLKIRQIIIPHLEEWDMRMEDRDGPWIHLDTHKVISKRYFKP